MDYELWNTILTGGDLDHCKLVNLDLTPKKLRKPTICEPRKIYKG